MTGRTASMSSAPRRQSAAARRERARARPGEILNAARDIFSRKGFEAARMDEVAAAAGVTKPAVYRYFPGRIWRSPSAGCRTGWAVTTDPSTTSWRDSPTGSEACRAAA